MTRLGLYALAALAAAPLSAAPPPPPPSYVSDVAALLTKAGDQSQPRIADFVARDVKVYVNGRLVAQGKADWLRRYAAHRPESAELLGYSEGWDANGGSVMIVDQFDTVDRSKLPAIFVADPRYDTRSTLYQFGRDHKIHAIRTLITTGFWIKP